MDVPTYGVIFADYGVFLRSPISALTFGRHLARVKQFTSDVTSF